MTSRRLLGAVAVAAAALVPASVRADVTIRVAPEVVVQADQLFVSDLGPIEGDQALAARLRSVGLGPAPIPGSSYRLDPSSLPLRLRQHQIDPATVHVIAPERVTVVRAFQTLPGQALVEAATHQALERLEALDPNGGPYTLVPISRPGEIRIPLGDVSLLARPEEAPAPFTVLRVAVMIRVDGRDYQTLPLAFRVARQQRVVVASRVLEPKAALDAADFRLELRPSTEAPPGALTAVTDPEDLEVVRSIRPGEVLTERLLRRKVVVRRGETVTLLLEGRGFRVTARGEAREDARRGDVVRVVNPTSKREVMGRVEGPGVVRVAP